MSKKTKPLQVGKVTIGGKDPAFILGPCVIESEKFVLRMAKKIAEICSAEDVRLIFKASYDKANRSSLRSFRGLGPGCSVGWYRSRPRHRRCRPSAVARPARGRQASTSCASATSAATNRNSQPYCSPSASMRCCTASVGRVPAGQREMLGACAARYPAIYQPDRSEGRR